MFGFRFWGLGVVVALGCGDVAVEAGPQQGGDGGRFPDAASVADGGMGVEDGRVDEHDGGVGVADAGLDAGPPPVCGDGWVTGGEECDDGARAGGDGCDATCVIEKGWRCGAEPTVCTALCGDGLLVGEEECDDGANVGGDGCDGTCAVESGWVCEGAPAVCATICGDSAVAGVETCDDGNASASDGCSDTCAIEVGWTCAGLPSACTAVCGDGLTAAGAETCDDANASSGDGCGATCSLEPGWSCSGAPSACATTCGDAILAGSEVCDDGNTAEDDGCSPSCTVEVGFGTGIDGPLVITSHTTLPLVAAQVISASAGSRTATIANVAGTFQPGRRVLLHQTRDATGAAGLFEYARIESISDATVAFTQPLARSYATAGLTRAQMVLVREHTSVTIDADLYARDWNNLGQLGGILAIDATGPITIGPTGRVLMSARGFHGHARGCPLQQCVRGTTGESITGPGGARTTANATGGGAGATGDDGAGGGGGGNGTPGESGSDGTCAGRGVCDASCPIRGGEGGEVSPGAIATHLFLGGAGGEGGSDSEGARPGAGGYGGGIIALRSATVLVHGRIVSDGSNGGGGVSTDTACGGSGCGMGGGGGGAGGSIRIVARESVALGDARVTARGGAGGRSTCGAMTGVGGGAGGSGLVGVSAPVVSGSADPAYVRF